MVPEPSASSWAKMKAMSLIDTIQNELGGSHGLTELWTNTNEVLFGEMSSPGDVADGEELLDVSPRHVGPMNVWDSISVLAPVTK